MPSYRLGINAYLAVKEDGVGGSGSFEEVGLARDVSFDASNSEDDVTAREGGGWRQFVPTLSEGTLEFTMTWRPGDEAFDLIREAHEEKKPIGVRVLDGPAGNGWEFDAAVFGFAVSQDAETAQSVAVTMRVTATETAPVWVDEGESESDDD